MTTNPTAGLEFRITGDASGYKSALADAQKAHRAVSADMVKSLEEATSRIGVAMRVFREQMIKVLETIGGNVAEAAKETGNLWQGAVQGSAESVNKVIHQSISGMISAFGGAWGRMGVAVYGLLEAPINGALERGKKRVAEWLLENQNRFSEFSTRAEVMLGLPSGVRERAAIGENTAPALERIAVGEGFSKVIDAINERVTQEERATEAIGESAGAVARLRAEYEILGAAGVESLDKLTARQRTLATAALEAIEQAAQARQDREREVQAARQYEATVTSMTAALSRQSAMERANAEAIRQTAGERARARALAMAEGFHSGRGANAANDSRVRSAIDASVAEADASARIRLTNEMSQAMDQQTAAYMVQVRAIGATAGEQARLTFESQQYQAAIRAGVPVTEEMRLKIEQNGQSIRVMADAVARAQEQFRVLQDIGRTVANSLEQAFDKWMSSGKFKFSEFIKSLQADLAKLAFREAVGGLFGTGQKSTNPMGLIGGALSGIFAGFRAEGGPVSSGRAYMVGERGPEMFVPRSSGSIVPNMAGRGGDTTIRMSIDLTGANGDETIARIAGDAAARAANAAIARSSATFPARQRQLQMLGS